VILDPFFGSGTTGSVAKKLHRHWIGIEKDENYVRIATDRISMVNVNSENLAMYQQNTEKRDKPRIPFGTLIEMELLKPGQALYYRKDRSRSAVIRVDGKLQTETVIGSIHHVARQFAGGVPTNGWEVWFYEDTSGVLNPIDQLRVKIKEIGLQ
jgi:modification methylase